MYYVRDHFSKALSVVYTKLAIHNVSAREDRLTFLAELHYALTYCAHIQSYSMEFVALRIEGEQTNKKALRQP